jgi:hypothetical protein
MCGRRTVRPLAEPLSVASASAAHRSRVAAPWAPVQPRPVSLPMRPTPAATCPLPERRQSWRRTATVPRRMRRPAAAALRTMCARLVRSRPTPPRDPAQTRAPGHTGMNSNSECASFVWYLRRPVTRARARAGRRLPRWRPRPVRPHSHACACARCSARALRPVHARTTPAETEKRFGPRRAVPRRAGAPARTPRSCASAARRVSGAPRRDELVRCDVRARERGGRRPER